MNISLKEQENIIAYTRANIDTFSSQSTLYREQMLQIYETLSTFELPDTGDVLTRFKINKAHEILRKVVPRVIANPPKMTVTPRTDVFETGDIKINQPGKERDGLLDRNNNLANAAQEYLNALFQGEHFKERLKLWVIAQLTYGNSFAQIVPKFKIQRSKDKNQKVTEKVVGLLPSLDIVSWTEMYYDARYKMLEDMPGVLRVRKKVRLQDILFTKGYFNLDKLTKLAGTKFIDTDSYSQSIFSITGISDVNIKVGLDANNLDLQIYEGKYSLTGNPRDERLYEIVTVNSAIVIGIKEITEISFVDIKGHEDPEVFFSVGLIAPIIGLQDELNFQKNAQATAMSKSLNRSYLWAAESGIDPNNLVGDKPGNIIVANNGVEQAKRNFEEVRDNQLPAQYFSNINDYNRDIQSLSHTTDVSQPGGNQAITNTATGARISFFESNSVIAELRKNFEKGVQELAYKILDWTANNIDKDIVIPEANSKKFLKINIKALKNAIERYDIRVESNSSAYDDVENRRADAIALKNLLMEAKNAGANVNIDEGFRKVFSTFEHINIDKLMPKVDGEGGVLPPAQGTPVQGGNIPKGAPAVGVRPTTPAELTSAVAGGTNLLNNN